MLFTACLESANLESCLCFAINHRERDFKFSACHPKCLPLWIPDQTCKSVPLSWVLNKVDSVSLMA